MRFFCSLKAPLALGCVLALSTFAALAQVPGSSPTGVNARLIILFGDIKSFSAKADIQVLDKSQTETMSGPMDFALLDEKIRVDIDVSKMKGRQMTPEMAMQLKQMGMERVSTIVRSDKKEMYTLFHVMQACLAMPLPKDEVAAIEKPPKVEKAELGKESVNGHSCVKTKVTMTDASGQKSEATTWNAADLKTFPVRIQTMEKDNTLIMNFSEVQFAKPETGKFDVPKGYDKYADMQELVAGVMKRMMNGAPGAGPAPGTGGSK